MCLAVPAELISITGENPLGRTGKVSISGILKEISLACVPEAKIGDYLLVHAGIALNVIDEQEARTTFEYLDEIEQLGSGKDTGS
jgi:hydrogenase expression/formation protein HypC